MNSVVIERTVDAPIELVWKMWTEEDHFSAWYGPKGATIPVANKDVQVGGTRLICIGMQTPNGIMKMWFKGEYLEIVDKARLVYTESMCDENGNVKSPTEMGMPPGHPSTTMIIVELKDIGGQTLMMMTHVGVLSDSPGAMGWEMALDKLEAHVASQADSD